MRPATNIPVPAILGVGAVSPVGRSAIETCAAVRADICRFREWSRYSPVRDDPEWEKPEAVVASIVPDVSPRAEGATRVLELATLALRDLVSRVSLRRADLAHASLFLALPELDAVTRKWTQGADMGAKICTHAGLPHLKLVAARAEGSPGSLAIFGEVAAHLTRVPTGLAIVVLVDSYIDEERLAVLDQERRLKSALVTDGLLPGEAGVAMLIEMSNSALSRQARPLGFLGPVGVGRESQVRSSDKESSGRGLCEALRAALVGAPAVSSRWCLCDSNGQSYRAAEWGLALARLSTELSTVSRTSHPADCLGDVGSATGGLLIAQGLAGFARGYARADQAIAWASSSECDLRAAVRISPPRK